MWKKFCEQVARFDLQRAVVVAGVTAEILCVVHVAVHHELHPMLRVEQQPHHRGGAGVRVEQLLHFLRRSEGQAGRADLRGEILCVERLVAGHGEQIKRRLLAVAEKEVLADPRTQHLLHGGAGLDRVGSIVIDAIIAQPQTVEQVVAAQLLVEPVRVLGPAVIYGLVNKHGVTP